MVMIVADQKFIGANFGRNPKELVSGIGVNAVELDTTQGAFQGRRAATSVHTLVGYGGVQQQSLYRMGRETASDTLYWIAYALDVDFARSLLASDPLERTYGMGGDSGIPQYTDNTFLGSTPYPTGGYKMGIPAPGTGMTAAVATAGSGSNETRVYVATFTRYNGDESAPSATVEIVCPKGSTVTLTAFPAYPVGNTSGIDRRRFYVSTGGDFQRCGEATYATTSITDTGTRGEVLQSGGSPSKPAWLEPPDTGRGLIELWAGMHGAFDGKQYMTCHPFNPHAWPAQYRRAVPDTIVGSAKWGQNWLLATTGMPRVVMGTSPLAMVDAPINFKEACVSKRSVVGVPTGVCWASNRGLCYHGTKGTYLITKDLFTIAQWRALVPSTIIGANWGTWYVGFYNDGVRKAFMIDTADPTFVILVNQGAYAIFSDALSDTLYILDSGNVIKKWDAGSVGSATFKSRVIRHPQTTNAGAAKIIATTYPVTFSFWADGALKVNAQSITSDDGFRLPGGYAADEFQYQIVGTGPVEAVFIAEEMADLP